MIALQYEHLIRRAYQVGRFGNSAANADIFRDYEKAFSVYNSEKELEENNRPKQWGIPANQLKKEYLKLSTGIVFNIDNAINKFISIYRKELTDEQLDTLLDCKTQLQKSNYKSICKVINDAEEVMVELGVFPK